MFDLLTPRDAAGRCKTSVATIYRLIRDEGLPTVRLSTNGDIRIRPEDLEAWLESRRIGASA